MGFVVDNFWMITIIGTKIGKIIIGSKQKQENKYPCASLRGVEFLPHGKKGERGAALGVFVLLFILKTQRRAVRYR